MKEGDNSTRNMMLIEVIHLNVNLNLGFLDVSVNKEASWDI